MPKMFNTRCEFWNIIKDQSLVLYKIDLFVLFLWIRIECFIFLGKF